MKKINIWEELAVSPPPLVETPSTEADELWEEAKQEAAVEEGGAWTVPHQGGGSVVICTQSRKPQKGKFAM